MERFCFWMLAILLQCSASAWAAAASEARPNVVLIISDDQGWSDFGFMGSEIVQTPHLKLTAMRAPNAADSARMTIRAKWAEDKPAKAVLLLIPIKSVAAYNISSFTDVDEFKERMDWYLREMEATPPAPGATCRCSSSTGCWHSSSWRWCSGSCTTGT